MSRKLEIFSTLVAVVILTVSLHGLLRQSSAQDAVPANEAARPPIEGLFSDLFEVALTADQRPTDGPWGVFSVSFTRRTWAPGATGNGSSSSSQADSVRIDYVLAGTVTMQPSVADTLQVQRAADPDGMPGPVESFYGPTEVELNLGDVVVHPPETQWSAKNNRTDDAVVLSVVIDSSISSSVSEGYEGVAVEDLGFIDSEEWAQVPSGPLAISLRRGTLAPGVDLPPYPVSPTTPEILAVESGVMEIRDYLADGTDLGSVVVARGELAPVPYWDQASRSIGARNEPPAGSSDARQNAPEPLVFLSLSVGPAQTASSSPASPETEFGSSVYRSDAAGGFAAWNTEWQLVDGMLANDGGDDSVIFAPHDLGSNVDYAVEAEIQATGTATSVYGRFGLVVRGGDPVVDVRGLVQPAAGKAMLLLGDDILAETVFFPEFGWHTYRIEIRGNVARLLVDGHILLEATDDRLRAEAGGRVGLCDAGVPIAIRRFEILVR